VSVIAKFLCKPIFARTVEEGMAGWRQSRKVFAVYVGVLAVVPLAGAAPAAMPRLSVVLSPRPATVQIGERWRTTITVAKDGKPFLGTPPRVELRLGNQTVRFSSTRARRGVFRARFALARVGRWSVSVKIGQEIVSAGALTVVPGLTGALDVAVLPNGSLVVGDAANYVLRTRAGRRPAIVAGNGLLGSTGDGGRATAAAVGFPVEVASDPRGGITVVTDERRIRRIAPAGTISTLAVLAQPTAHTHDGEGNIFVSELGGSVRRIDARSGALTTVARGLDRPHGLVADGDGAIVVCETFANRLVRVDATTGRVTAFATALNQPVDIARAPDGTFVVADAGNNRIARVTRNGVVTKLVDVPGPQSVAVDAGLVYFTDRTLARVLRLDSATGAVATVLRHR
jgi:outer membrane protein assembly factor BamB